MHISLERRGGRESLGSEISFSRSLAIKSRMVRWRKSLVGKFTETHPLIFVLYKVNELVYLAT